MGLVLRHLRFPLIIMARGRVARKNKNTQGNDSPKQDVPDVYQEMLSVVVPSSPTLSSQEGRAVKRRRVGGRIVTQRDESSINLQPENGGSDANDSGLDELFEDENPPQQQAVQTDSEDSADSDVDWEEVQVRDHASQHSTPEPENAKGEVLSLVMRDHGDENIVKLSGRLKRKPMTAEDKQLRVQIHKMHVCCLIAHVHIRNHWCNDEEVYVGC